MLAVRAGPVSGLPVRRTTFHIRLDRVEEAAALSDLRLRLRAVWGYEAGFMALMPAALRVALEDIAAGDVWFVIGAKGQIARVVALAPGDVLRTLDLSKLFIEPCHMRGDIGYESQKVRAWSASDQEPARTP
jgi:hypothetical protein